MTRIQPDKHKPRDNKLGVRWCVNCGSLFTKPCVKELKESDKLTFNTKKITK